MTSSGCGEAYDDIEPFADLCRWFQELGGSGAEPALIAYAVVPLLIAGGALVWPWIARLPLWRRNQ